MTERRGRLIVIAGLPGAGKTRLATALAARHAGTIYSPDDWMEALGIDLWDSTKREAIEALQWRQAQDLLRLGGTAIIEWGTWGRSERDTLREDARALGAAAELHFLDAPPEVLYQRTITRGRENPPLTLEQLREYSATIERPTAEEFALFDPPSDPLL
ncbi:MAG TPA: ATP-binding protein [Devosia sp.]|nr:ATP-binding protein [Devosia sp.]